MNDVLGKAYRAMSNAETLDRVHRKKIHIEFLRVLAIFFVIFNHTNVLGFVRFSIYEPGSMLFWINLVRAVNCKLGASMFFMISGALLIGKTNETTITVYRKRLPKYIIILIVFSALYSLSDAVFRDEPLSVRSFLTELYTSDVHYHLWFLYAYISFLVALPLLRAFCKGIEVRHLYYILGVYLALKTISVLEYLAFDGRIHIADSILIDYPENTLLLPVVGYIVENKLELSAIKGKLKYFWAINILCIALSCYVTYVKGIRTGVFSEAESQTFLSVFSLFNCFTVYATARYVFDRIHLSNVVEKAITLLGGCCFGVYLLHPFFKDIPLRNMVLWFFANLNVPPLIMTWVYVLYLFLTSFIVTALFQLVKKLWKKQSSMTRQTEDVG